MLRGLLINKEVHLTQHLFTITLNNFKESQSQGGSSDH